MANSKDNISKYAKSFIGFDEIGGNVYDNISGYTGTVYNTPSRVSGWDGKGSAMSFNGTNQYIEFNGKLMPVGAKSIRFKIKVPSIPSELKFITSDGNGSAEHGSAIIVTETGRLRWNSYYGVTGSQRFTIESTINICDNELHDILLTWDGTTNPNAVKMYVDDMITPNITGTAINEETNPSGRDLFLAKHSLSPIYFNFQIDAIEIYDRVISAIPDKHLVFHAGQYKYHNGTEWLTTTNTEANFIQYGMNNFSHITENQWKELSGEKSIVVWSDFESKQYVSAVLEKDPFTAKDLLGDEPQIIYYTDSDADQVIINTETDVFSVYDYISETPEINVYTESNQDITVSTTTEPFDLYDEFGDEVEILTYTDNEDATEANLILEANWSPIDELEGDFEVVTWTDEDSSTTERILNMTATPKGQFIIPAANNLHYGEIQSFISSLISDNEYLSLTRFLLSFDNGVTWKGYKFDKWINVDVNDKYDIRNHGMKNYELNALTEAEFLSNEFKLGYYLEDRGWTSGDEGIYEIVIKDDAYVDGIEIDSLAFYILNTTATINLTFNRNKIIGVLDDADQTKVQYRVRLNGNYYYPNDSSFTKLENPPHNINLIINDTDIVFGWTNNLVVEFKDAWGQVDAWSVNFTGTPSGLLFSDPSGEYYSTSLGAVLKYLEIEQLIAGQTSLDYQVNLENKIGYSIHNVLIEGINPQEGVRVELSKTQSPFVSSQSLSYEDRYLDGDVIPFYVRLTSDVTTNPNRNGTFKVKVRADRYNDEE